MVTRSVIQVEDPKRKILVTILLDNKGFAGENTGALCGITNNITDELRKHANAHEIKVTEYGKVIVADKKKKGR